MQLSMITLHELIKKIKKKIIELLGPRLHFVFSTLFPNFPHNFDWKEFYK